MIHTSVPILGFAAFSGTGKTTLLKQLITLLNEKHVRVGIIKQSHHDIDIDHPGKDSYELRRSGALQTLITSPHRWALIQENPIPLNTSLVESIAILDTDQLDIILVEGYKLGDFPKIELHRSSLNKPLLYPEDDHIIAIATDETTSSHSIPALNLNDPLEIMAFIDHHILSSNIIMEKK